MTLATFSDVDYTPSGASGWLARQWSRFCAWQARRLTLRLLRSLDDITLRDLGITPNEIESLVYNNGDGRPHRYDPYWWPR